MVLRMLLYSYKMYMYIYIYIERERDLHTCTSGLTDLAPPEKTSYSRTLTCRLWHDARCRRVNVFELRF